MSHPKLELVLCQSVLRIQLFNTHPTLKLIKFYVHYGIVKARSRSLIQEHFIHNIFQAEKLDDLLLNNETISLWSIEQDHHLEQSV